MVFSRRRRNDGHRDGVSDDAYLPRLLPTLPHDRKHDLGALRSAYLGDRMTRIKPCGGLTVYLQYLVPALETRGECRRIFERRDNGEYQILNIDLHTDPFETSLHVGYELLILDRR